MMNVELRRASGSLARFSWAFVRRRANRFRKGERASAAIEFAMLSPIFFALILEIFQFGMYIYISSNLDYATTSAARQILTGAIGNQNLTASQFLSNVICPKVGGTSCSSNVVVNLMNVPATSSSNGYLSLVNSTGTDLVLPPMSNGSTSFCPGFSGGVDPTSGQAGVEVLEIFYPMPVFSLFWLSISTSVQGQSVYYVRGMATFQNEPYAASTQTGGC